jgi:hypothetical protein
MKLESFSLVTSHFYLPPKDQTTCPQDKNSRIEYRKEPPPCLAEILKDLSNDFDFPGTLPRSAADSAFFIQHMVEDLHPRGESPQVALDSFRHCVEQAPCGFSALSELRTLWLAPFPEHRGNVGGIDGVLIVETNH